MSRRLLAHALAVGALVAAWELLVRAGWASGFHVGRPSAVAASIARLAGDGTLERHALVSLRNLLAGYLLGTLAGGGLGVLAGYHRRVYENVKGYAQLSYAVPQLVLIPFLIIWFGVGDAAKTGIVFLMTFFPVFIAAMESAKATPPELAEVCAVYGAGRGVTLLYLVLPASAVAILAGARIAVARAVAGMILGETFGRAEGLGYLLFHFGSLYSVNDMMAALAVILAVSVALFFGIDVLEARVIRWRR